MSQWPHLPNAPITEALIDIRVKLPAEVTLETLSTFQDGIRARYPNRRERASWQSQFEVAPGAVPRVHEPTGGVDGYLFVSPEGTQIVQARRDGFTFSRLKPYETWEQLKDEAGALWDQYKALTRPVQILRSAVRYINRIEIPLPVVDLRRWFHTTPEVARTLPQGLSEFFIRLVIPFDDPRATAIVTQTVVQSDERDVVPIILDIDAFQDETCAPDAADLWDRFEQLRKVKNRVFFESITKETEELFKCQSSSQGGLGAPATSPR